MGSLNQLIRELLFFSTCIVCKEREVGKRKYICDECLKELRKEKKFRQMGNIYYFWSYDGVIKKLIREYKHKNKRYISRILCEEISRDLETLILRERIDFLLPVPLNIKRLYQRGFDQLEEILNYGNFKYIKGKRVKNTKKMSFLKDSEERLKNIEEAFETIDLGDKEIVRVLIFDDIVTTGATIKELKRELERRNSKKKLEIFVICLALGKTIKLKKI